MDHNGNYRQTEEYMFFLEPDDLSLQKIAESGQTFRWAKTDNDTWRIIHADSCLNIRDLGNGRFEADCDEMVFQNVWFEYFDLDEDYHAIRNRIDRIAEPFLWDAAESEKGIRILRQDPWEMLISFIISQNKNIPAIRDSIEKLARTAGKLKVDGNKIPYYAFPGPEEIARLNEDQLKACSLGYRCSFVHEAAKTVCDGKLDIDSIQKMKEEEVFETLQTLAGVGPKVASCVCLFGFHFLNAFPKDVWIHRVLDEHYPAGFPYEKYSPFNGVYQQYLFAYARSRADII